MKLFIHMGYMNHSNLRNVKKMYEQSLKNGEG